MTEQERTIITKALKQNLASVYRETGKVQDAGGGIFTIGSRAMYGRIAINVAARTQRILEALNQNSTLGADDLRWIVSLLCKELMW